MPVMFLTLKNVSTAQGLVFLSLSVHCTGNNEVFYLLISVVEDRLITKFELFGLMLSPFPGDNDPNIWI